jgi:hypothetical protein
VLLIALILLGAWLAIVIVALAMARAAGRADADEERAGGRADQSPRPGATVSGPDRPAERPIPNRSRASKRLRGRLRKSKADEVKNSLH